jgi:RimJ/RimL family protein N-acetyltransferase
MDDWAGRVRAHWAVADSQTAAVVGRASLKNVNLLGGQAEVAYWTLPIARGRGVASRAVEALTAWAFEEVGFHRLQLTHSVDNPASCRVATRAGYLLEGTKRSAGLHLDGWHDMHLHARVADR